MKSTDLTRHVARSYNCPLSLSNFLIMLIRQETVSSDEIYQELGVMEYRQMIYRLRALVPSIKINNQRQVGYWLDGPVRVELAAKFGIELAA